jgi:hypothetical protein
VPAIPWVLIDPLTDLSLFTLIVPVPVAEVVTGGVSSAPLNVTCTSFAPTDADASSNAAAITALRPENTLEQTDDTFIAVSHLIDTK